jgi:hypothetical protein
MHRLPLILLGVLLGSFLLCVINLMTKEGLSAGDAAQVVACSYGRVGSALMSGRFNVHAGLMTTQCMSDVL